MDGSMSTMRVLTFNVWFDEKLRDARTRGLVEVLNRERPDVCCLQEVVPEVAVQLMSRFPTWKSSDPGDGSSVGSYGVMALVRPGLEVRFSFHKLPTDMDRRLLVTRLHDMAIGTVHLESLANHMTRQAQLRECSKVLAAFHQSDGSDALLVGDFNFDSERNFAPPHLPLENEALAACLPGFTDVWPFLRADRGLTFDSAICPYIRQAEQMRYDRVMSRAVAWKVDAIERVGHEQLHIELSEREQREMARPPTPGRPSSKPRPDPFQFVEALPVETPQRQDDCPAERHDVLRHETPPRKGTELFLSDHFGLIASFIRNDVAGPAAPGHGCAC